MKGKEAIVSLTAYDHVTAGLEERCGVDILLVGDSLGNVILGYENTLSVTLDDMIRHSAAVARGSQKALIVTDMPFLSFQTSVEDALRNAGKLLTLGGAQAVKLEGGKRNVETVKRLTEAGIPVMGHVGLTPQSYHITGGYKKVGKTNQEKEFVFSEAVTLEKAGAFSVVLECIDYSLAADVTKELKVPTIGIASGKACDGQVLVINDLLGYGLEPPPFLKPHINLAAIVQETIQNYVDEVKKDYVS